MIIKLNKESTSTEGTDGINIDIFQYSRDGFGISSYQQRKVKFLETKYEKNLHFLDTLELYAWSYWNTFRWYKKQ